MGQASSRLLWVYSPCTPRYLGFTILLLNVILVKDTYKRSHAYTYQHVFRGRSKQRWLSFGFPLNHPRNGYLQNRRSQISIGHQKQNPIICGCLLWFSLSPSPQNETPPQEVLYANHVRSSIWMCVCVCSLGHPCWDIFEGTPQGQPFRQLSRCLFLILFNHPSVSPECLSF